MKVLIVEELNAQTLSRHSSLVADANVCLPLNVSDGSAAEPALNDERWQAEHLPVYESAVARHAAWVHELVTSQRPGGLPLPASYEALVCYGLEIRLRQAVLALAYLKEVAKTRGCNLDQIDVRIVGDDPYLRDAFTRPEGIASQLKSVALSSWSRPTAMVSLLKEKLRASRAVRRLVFSRAGGTFERFIPFLEEQKTSSRKKIAALFVLNQRYLDIFRPVLSVLASRDWSVRVFYYNPIEDPGHDAEPFATAVAKARHGHRASLVVPAWTIPGGGLKESPVAEQWLRTALTASWLTGWDKISRHERLLSSLKPNVVISYSIDPMGLGLHGAAESLGIPSLFIHHGPQGRVPSCWFFRWSASALAGQPCVEANAKSPFGVPHRGLVAVGHPPYDKLLTGSSYTGMTKSTLEWVRPPSNTPFLVLVLAEYGHLFWVHALQRRMLQMVAGALPEDCFLVCKLHPSGEHEREQCEKVLGSMLPAHRYTVIGEGQHRTPDLLTACDVAVATERCMALTDAIFMRRPAIGIRFPEIPLGSNDLKHPARGPEFWKCCWVVRDKIEMREALVALTRDADARDALIKNRKRYIESFYLASDGRASHRVADLIEHLGEGKDAESFVPAIGASLLEE